MANLAKWEPVHGRFKFRHPWKRYLKVGTLARECGYKIQALNCCLNFDIQTSLEIRSKIREMCMEISMESGKAFLELASSTKKITRAKSANPHTAKGKNAMEKLNSHLKTKLWKEAFLLEIIPVAKLLIEVVECTEKIAQAVHELALAGSFRDRGCFGVARRETIAVHSRNSVCFHHGCTESHMTL